VLRRSFLKLTGWAAAGIGVLAHHKPGHQGGPPTTTTSTTSTTTTTTSTTLPPAGDGDLFHDAYAD
jgi:hypothetical protein